MEISINPKKISAILFAIIAVLAALHIGQLIAYYVIADPGRFDFIELIDFDFESNLPSFYSMFAIILCSGVLFMIAAGKNSRRQPYGFHWEILAWIFLYLSLDEGLALHEEVGDLMEKYITASGYLYFPWVIPYTILVGILAVFYFRFLLHLPRPTMVRFIIAGSLFLTGAVGLEIVSANEADTFGTTTITYSVLYTLEELCEMIAMVIFLRALLEYYSHEFGTLSIKFSK